MIFTIQHVHNIQLNKIQRLTGFVDIKDIFSAFKDLNLEGNPRESKKNKVTDQIIKTLKDNPELFPYKSKGILMGGEDFSFDARTGQLTFDLDSNSPINKARGIFDGGHNLFAIGHFLLEKTGISFKGENDWESLSRFWVENQQKIESNKHKISDLNILVPIEVVLPVEGEKKYFSNAVTQIRQARNTNSQLPSEALANQDGKYEYLKRVLPEEVNELIRWKENSSGEIPVRHLLALSWVPLSLIDFKDLENFSPPKKPQSYSSKNVTSDKYSELLEFSQIATKDTGTENWTITHKGVRSALDMIKQFVEIYDIVYKDFKNAYNRSGGKYNNIRQVREDKSKKKDRTPYGYYEFNDKYPFEGYIWPIIYSAQALIRRDDFGVLSWIVDPIDFYSNIDNLSEIIGDLKGLYKLADFDPQKIGKEPNYYSGALRTVGFIALENNYYKKAE